MGRSRSGRLAAVYESVSSPIQSGWTAMTWDATNSQATVGSNFWLHSYDHCVEVRMDGILTGGAITPSATSDSIVIAAFTGYLGGSSFSVAAGSLSGIAQATTASNRIVYAITYNGTALAAVAGTSGTASTTRGAAGAAPFIPVGSVCLGYVTRLDSAAEVVTSGEITLTDFDGRQWANVPGYDELRNLKGQLDFISLPTPVHTGSTYPAIYWRGYNFSSNFQKIGEMRNWTLDITPADEEATTQNSFADESDVGRVSYALSYEEFVPDVLHEAFSHVNNSRGDRIYKLYQDRNDTANYRAAQGREQVSMSFPLDDKATSSNTVTITGRVEEFSS